MAFVVSAGALRTPQSAGPVSPPHGLRLSDQHVAAYAELWRTQPAVRTVTSFLARNVASLGLHVYRRTSDTDRERMVEHPVARLLARPNPGTTRYRWLDSLVADLAVYDAAFCLKVTDDQPALVRLPPERVRPIGEDWLWPEAFELAIPTPTGLGRRVVEAGQVVYFRGHHPTDARIGCSPLESLRRVLAEEFEAGRMRQQVLRNGARTSGYLERPADAPQWSAEAKSRFRADWQAQYTGEGPAAGGTPILEDGMHFVPAAQTAEQLQYIEARRLTREEVAAAYHVPPPMVGILEHASFSNISQQHRMLYQDTLGPWLTMICEELGLQLLPDFADTGDVYVEFNLAEKLRGSFEEQAQQLSSSVGAPWLTRNEARARLNLPSLPDGDELVTPLNVLEGGLASPRDTAPEPGSEEGGRG